jgi:hypothetical protein
MLPYPAAPCAAVPRNPRLQKGKGAAAAAGPGGDLLGDGRFSAMFQREEFAVDEADAQFKLYHPSGMRKAATAPGRGVDDEESEEQLLNERFQR